MPNGKVSAKEIIEDIKKGLTDSAMTEKYKVSPQSLKSVFKQLIDKGLIKKEELEKRSQPFVCPACNRSSNKQFEECPYCGVIVAKFLLKKSKESKQTTQVSSSEKLNHTNYEPTDSSESIQTTPNNSEELASSNQQYKNCPYCGEQILYIAKKCKFCGEFLEQPDNKQLQKKLVNEEKILWEGHPSHLHYLGFYILGIFLLLIFIISYCYFGFYILGSCIFDIFFLLGPTSIIYSILDCKARKFTVTNRKVTSTEGIIARSINEVAIKDVRNINFKQNIIEMLFGLGSIEIGTAGTAGIEVKIIGISESKKVKDIISKLKNAV